MKTALLLSILPYLQHEETSFLSILPFLQCEDSSYLIDPSNFTTWWELFFYWSLFLCSEDSSSFIDTSLFATGRQLFFYQYFLLCNMKVALLLSILRFLQHEESSPFIDPSLFGTPSENWSHYSLIIVLTRKTFLPLHHVEVPLSTDSMLWHFLAQESDNVSASYHDKIFSYSINIMLSLPYQY